MYKLKVTLIMKAYDIGYLGLGSDKKIEHVQFFVCKDRTLISWYGREGMGRSLSWRQNLKDYASYSFPHFSRREGDIV